MNYSFFDLLTLLGALGVFLFGMKYMSEALQKIAGNKMRSILSTMTSNRFLGVLTGFIVTAFIQSSSATTVMVVSFVNAGLLTLTQSIGVVMGANIGTTITAWLISILGFKVSISAISLPLIALGFPLLLTGKNKLQSWGEFIIGFALLFIGLQFLKDAVPDIRSNPDILSFLSKYVEGGYFSVLLFVGIGTLLTVIIQSSSATMALTLVMCAEGWIPFELAAAMVLGENIGTTITANLAALVGNTSAKRTGRAHFLFNAIGVTWVLIIFFPFLRIIDSAMTFSGADSPFESALAIPIALSIFHTSFNVLNTFALIWFVPQIQRISERWVKDTGEDEEFELRHISTGLMSTAELSLLQARKEVGEYTGLILKMFMTVRSLFKEKDEKKFNKLFKKVDKCEKISDSMEEAIATYLTKIAQDKLSAVSATNLRLMFKLIEDLEEIGDEFMNITRTLAKQKIEKAEFNDYIRKNLTTIFDLMERALDIMDKNVNESVHEVILNEAQAIVVKINKIKEKLKSDHVENLRKGRYKHKVGLIYNDIISKSNKAAEHVASASNAAKGIKKGK